MNLRLLQRPSLQPAETESPAVQTIINALHLQPHIEGGYFAETDRDRRLVSNPFSTGATIADHPTNNDGDDAPSLQPLVRSASTSIFYLLTPRRGLGALHRNRARTVHTLHSGRARYVVLHADEVASSATHPGGYARGNGASGSLAGEEAESLRWTSSARVEIFTVGHDVARGERLQWVVEGGKYKASFLLADREGGGESECGCLISETVVPGFEYEDHDFMTRERFEVLIPDESKAELAWLLRGDA